MRRRNIRNRSLKFDAFKLVDEMARQKLSVLALAAKAELSPTTIRFATLGGKTTTQTLGKVAAALGIDPPSSLLAKPNSEVPQ